MSDEPDSPVLRYLRRMDETMDRVIDRNDDVMNPVGGMDAGVRGEIAGQGVLIAQTATRVDKMERRLERIERRLDLVENRP